MEERQPLQQMFLGKLDISLQKNCNYIHICHPEQVLTHNGLRYLENSTGKSREYTGSNRHRQ
jgi:hypothetical protein